MRFRVWAPNARRVDVQIERSDALVRHQLNAEPDGYHSGTVLRARAGDRYRYVLDGGAPFPDPCSRSQPDGPHGPSEVVDPSTYQWHDAGWTGLGPDGLAIYELHVGTFTPGGTFDSAIERLPYLRDLGVTAVELRNSIDSPNGWGPMLSNFAAVASASEA